MAKSLGQALKEAREAAGKTQREVGVAAGVSRAAVGLWESDKNAPSTENLISTAAFLGTSVVALTGGRAAPATTPPREPSEIAGVLENPPLIGSVPRDIPVLGTAVGGETADFYWNGEVIDYVRRPPGIANARGIYAIYVAGDSMSPKFEEGEMVYVNPSRPAGIGDCVIVELHPNEGDGERSGPGYVKKLLRRTPTQIVCWQFNPEKEVAFARSEVKSVHRIVPWNELLGI